MSENNNFVQTRDFTPEEWFELYMKTKTERDQFKAELSNMIDQRDCAIEMLEKYKRERDEAREQNAKLRDIADKAIDWLKIGKRDDVRVAGYIQAALDKIKEEVKNDRPTN